MIRLENEKDLFALPYEAILGTYYFMYKNINDMGARRVGEKRFRSLKKNLKVATSSNSGLSQGELSQSRHLSQF